MALVPLSYSVRSLFVRKSTTVLTILSMGATVAVLAGVLALQQGFETTFVERGRKDLAIILRKGAGSETESAFPRDRVDILVKSSPEFAVDETGAPLASAECYLGVRRPKVGGGETNMPLRGVQPATFRIHGDDIDVIEGETFKPGRDEVIVGRSLVGRIRDCRIGAVLQINTTPFRVVGVFASKGGYQSEVWGDADRILAALKRDAFNRVIAVVKSPAAIEALAARLDDDERVPSSAVDEATYLARQTERLSAVMYGLGMFLAVVMGIAAVFTGTNAMLSALSARTYEVGILSAMGYKPLAIFFAFELEAVVIGLFGGVVGCLVTLPLNGIETGTTNFASFSEATFAFRTTPLVLGVAVVFSILLGMLGGAIPALRAARMRTTEALRRG